MARVGESSGAREPPKELEELEAGDYAFAASYIWEEHHRRKAAREELEHQWDETDRQVAMKPAVPPIDHESGRARRDTAWMPMLEPPWQAETLEILVTDLERMAFPAVGNHYEVDADAGDEVLVEIEQAIATQQGVLGSANQELVNEIVVAVHEVYQRIYGHRGQWRRMFAEAFKYGTMVGRQRPSPINIHAWDGEGYQRDLTIPVLSQLPIRNVYLDTSAYAAQRQGFIQSPGQIFEYAQKLPDLQLAANAGDKARDPKRLDGGWLPGQLEGLSAKNDRGDIDVLEWEGDFIFERSAGQHIYIPNVIITTVKGQSQFGGPERVVRIRYPRAPFPSYLYQPYFVDRDDVMGVYGTSPLLKGRPVQSASAVALNSWTAVIKLNAEPPVKYDPSDPHMAAAGGPVIAPRELWPSLSDVDPVSIGDPAALGAAYALLKQEYQDVTGTTAPRLGQQTKSHQTAFAIDTEMIRGLSRTVAFGQLVTAELMPRQLQMEWWLIRQHFPRNGLRVMLPRTKAWITVTKRMLPEFVRYSVAGASDPLIEQQKQQAKLVALQQVAAVDQVAQASGFRPVNWDELRRQILVEGGFTDVDTLFEQQLPTPALIPPAAGGTGGVAGAAANGPAPQAAGQGVPTATALRLAAGQESPVQ